MGSFHIAVVLMALVAASGASAQVTGIVTNRSATSSVVANLPAIPSPLGNTTLEFGSGSSNWIGSNFQVSANVGTDEIDFANNATTQGFIASTSSSTSVAVTYTNDGTSSVTPSLRSTILPGGFGFYVDNPSTIQVAGGYGLSDVNQAPQAGPGSTFTNFNSYGSGPGGVQATAGFTFQISSGGTVVASYADSVALYASPGGFSVVEAGPPALNGFALVTPASSDQAVGYQWNATTIDVPLGVTLAPGQSSTLTYTTTVTTGTYIGNTQASTSAAPSELLAYAGFGDPIGKAGGAKGISDPYFALLALGLPTFDPATGAVGLPELPKSLPSLPLEGAAAAPFEAVPDAVLGVPEPEAWTLMVAGVGLVGSARRRRRAALVA